jgi:triacylglycerol lipase
MAANNYPIVLAHGIARFDRLRHSIIERLHILLADRTIAPDRTHYFRRIRSHLEENGFETYHTSVSWASDVSVRGGELAEDIRAILSSKNHEKVHIIAHSMGGLDARYMLFKEDIADRVASLTTIGTPHLGTCYAVYALERGGDTIIEAFMEGLEIDFEGFLTLTPDARKWFNEEARNAEAKNDVVYHVYASSEEKARVRSFLRNPWQVVWDSEGINDGLVSVTSQLWQPEIVADDGTRKIIHQHHFPVQADHSNQIGWWDVNERQNGRWWQPGVLRQLREYEAQIRDVYLQIAREVTS